MPHLWAKAGQLGTCGLLSLLAGPSWLWGRGAALRSFGVTTLFCVVEPVT